MRTYAIRRVSTNKQEVERQLFETGIHFDEEFSYKSSGKDVTSVKGLMDCLDTLTQGDVLYFHDISRCARNTRQLLEIVESLTARGVTVKFYKEGIEFGGKGGGALQEAMGKMMLTLLGAVHTFQRTMQNSSTKDGLARAKAKGVKLGAANKKWQEANKNVIRKLNDKTRKDAIEHAETLRKEVEMMVSMKMTLEPMSRKLTELKLYTQRGNKYTTSGVKSLCGYLGLFGSSVNERYESLMQKA